MKVYPILNANKEDIIEKFKNLASPKDIAHLLEIEYGHLNHILYIHNRDQQYKTFFINKRSGGKREISTPATSLKILQKKLNYILSLVYEPKKCVQGFALGRSIVSNAQLHFRSNIILNIDLEDFFPSINFGRVRGLFMKGPFNLPAKVATIIAQICCHEQSLPQGAPTSPIISNLICRNLDSQLIALAAKNKCYYSRYADDLSFSYRKNWFPRSMAEPIIVDGITTIQLGQELIDIVTANGFKINQNKTKLAHKRYRQEVTGLIVNKFPNVRRGFVKEVRAMLHSWETDKLSVATAKYIKKYIGEDKKIDSLDFSEIVLGKINFIKSVRSQKNPIYRKFINKYNELMDNGKPVLPINFLEEEIFNSIFVVKCGNKVGTGFLLKDIGLVTCAHVIKNKIRDGIQVFKANDAVLKHWASVEKISDELDIAILKCNEINRYGYSLKYLNKGNSDVLSIGDKISVAGFPHYEFIDREPLITESKMSGTRKDHKYRDRIVISAQLFAGNSGGPALNDKNQVIGIAAMGAKNADHAKDISLYGIIPINDIKKLMIIYLINLLLKRSQVFCSSAKR